MQKFANGAKIRHALNHLLEGAAKNVERALFVVSGRALLVTTTTPESDNFSLFPLLIE